MKKHYTESEKVKARNEALSFAISTLTTNRSKSSVARKSYVRDIKDHLFKKGTDYDREISSLLSESEILRWEAFYQSVIKTKNASELRIAYLSEPNLENDIEILVENGVLPENIWAFESDNKTYTNAIISALESSRFPFVKIYKGKIENYLKILPFKFDIIYLDFCSTIASDKTLSVIRDIFYYQKLETLGVLITNFTFPNKENSKNLDYRDNLNLLAAKYLYSKPFTELHENLGGGFTETPSCHGIDWEDFVQIVKQEEQTFYSQLITRILFDLPSVIIPYQRLATNESLINLFFKNFKKSSFHKDYEEDLMLIPNENPLVWGLRNSLIEKESFKKTLVSLENNCQ